MNEDRTYLLKKEESLFQAALDEFSLKNFEEASLNDIIKNANYNKGSLYYRFKTKTDLYHALIDYVYTKQIALFNSEKIRLTDVSSPRDLYRMAFENIERLFLEEPRYYTLLRRIDLEPETVKEAIRVDCIKSLYQRFVERLKHLESRSDSSRALKLQIFLFRKIYYDYPFEATRTSGIDNIENLLEMLVPMHSSQSFVENSLIELETTNFYMNPSYILSDSRAQLTGDFTSVGSMIVDQNTPVAIKEKLKLRKLDLKGVITQGIAKNLTDFTYLLPLLDLDFSEVSYHNLTLMEKGILIMVYLNFIGTQVILFNHLLDHRKPKLIQLFFAEILPLLAKTSKIVLVDKEFPVSIGNRESMYLVRKDDSIIKIDPSKLDQLISDTYLVSYVNDQGLSITKRIKAEKFDFQDIKRHKYFQIGRTVTFRSSDLAGLE